MKGMKLFLALPVYGGVDPGFMQCLMRLVDDPPVPMTVRTNAGDSLVSRARNSLTADFLESDCTDLLFIDSDLIFSREHVARLASHPEAVVGGCYPKKQEGELAWVLNALQENGPRADGLQEVRYIGTGFLRVKRHVFETMAERFGEGIAYRPDHRRERTEFDFWSVGTCDVGDGYRRYLSEDWFFCERWLRCGGQVWADTKVILKHVGTAVYPLSYQAKEIFSGAAVKAPDGTGDRAIAPAAPGPEFSREKAQGAQEKGVD